MQHTHPALEREHLARHHAIAVLDARARLAHALLQLDELTHELTSTARDALAHDLVVFTEQSQKLRAGVR